MFGFIVALVKGCKLYCEHNMDTTGRKYVFRPDIAISVNTVLWHRLKSKGLNCNEVLLGTSIVPYLCLFFNSLLSQLSHFAGTFCNISFLKHIKLLMHPSNRKNEKPFSTLQVVC
jgi:hypothetical protein